MGRKITRSEVSKANTEDKAWVIIESKVYDVTEFAEEHPGGEHLIQEVFGQDATEGFNAIMHSDAAKEILEELYVGDLVPDSKL